MSNVDLQNLMNVLVLKLLMRIEISKEKVKPESFKWKKSFASTFRFTFQETSLFTCYISELKITLLCGEI